MRALYLLASAALLLALPFAAAAQTDPPETPPVKPAAFETALAEIGPVCGTLDAALPVLPDGASATEEELLKAIGAVKAFTKAANAFLDCHQKRKKKIFKRLKTAEKKNKWVEEYNRLGDAITDIQTALNAEIRAYKAK
ncbi:MAG: hypothetical protein V3R73_01230 [Sphingomonadales bacterium]